MSKKEDLELWKKVTADVKPLRSRSSKFGTNKEEDGVKQKVKNKVSDRNVKFDFFENTVEKKTHENRHAVDHRTAERLRRGQMPLDARLDLHGMTKIEAHRALERFIQGAYTQGKRCVLVVTGKGTTRHSGEPAGGQKQGILKQKVPEWLREEKLHDLVLKTCMARPKHGGEGAMYVLLRRKR